MALFGGNLAASTRERVTGEQDYSWWGNALLMPNLPTQQFNSETERVLNSVALTSGNLPQIQNAVNADLEFMKAFAIITLTVTIIATDAVKINILVREPNNISGKDITFIWDGTAGDLLATPGYTLPAVIPAQNGLQYVLGIRL
jgi:hypothetical protein